MTDLQMTARLDAASNGAQDSGFATRLLWIGGCVSVVLVLLFVITAIWKGFFGLELNAMGDALAGFFSCLAFLWLVLTMQLQIKELELQRQELRLARIANEEQTTQLAGTREATQNELQLLTVNQAVLIEEYRKRGEDDAVRAILGHTLYDLVPMLTRTVGGAEAATKIKTWQMELESARALYNAGQLADSLIVLSIQLNALELELDKPAIISEMAALNGPREKIETFTTLIAGFDLTSFLAKSHANIRYYLGVSLLYQSLRWLVTARESLPSAEDHFRKSTEELQARLAEMQAGSEELRESILTRRKASVKTDEPDQPST